MAVVQNYMQEDTILIDKIVYELKSQGIFDQFRKECIADVDTKPAYQNLRQRVEGSVGGFLSKQKWSPDMNKNQVREMLRKNIYESGFLETGVERIVDQVVNPKINSIFLPKVTEVVYKFFGIETETETKNQQTTSDLLPTDLEAVSPESEKHLEDSNLDDSKIDEDESPPFEPLEEQITYVPPEDNSVDSHISGLSEIDSNMSSKPMVIDTSNQDSMASKQSSEGRLSIVMSETDVGDKNFENLSEKIRKDEKTKSKNHEKSRSRSERERKDSSKLSGKNGKSDHRDKERSKSHNSSSHRHSSSHRSKESKDRKDRDKERSSRDKNKDERRKSHNSESKSSDRHKRDSHSSKSSSRNSKKDPKKVSSERSDACKKRSESRSIDRRSTDRDSNDGQSGLKSSSGSFDSLTSSQVSQQEKSQESNSNSNNGDSGNSDAHEDLNITVLEEINDEVSISAQSVKNSSKRRNRIMSDTEAEQENKENKSEEAVPESPPLRSVAVSAASWEALEAKLNESVANEQYYQRSYYDSPTETPEKVTGVEKVTVVEETVVAPPGGDECHYFEQGSCSKTERYVKFVSDLVGKLEKNIEKVENSSNNSRGLESPQSKEEDLTTGVKRKLIDTNTAVKQSNKRFNIEVHENFPLPLSPAESDNSVDKKSDISESSDRKDGGDVDKAKRNLRAPAKKQRYSSEDLYKPRPLFSGSRRRSGRNVGGVD